MMTQGVKKVSKALLRRLGYEVRHIRRSPETIKAQAGTDAPAYKEYISRWPVFSPWTLSDFQAGYLPVARFTAGSPERAYTLSSLARYAKHLPGDFAESGVYHGGSAYLLCRNLQDTNKKLYLFDSFQGLPKPDSSRDPYFKEGQYSAPLAATQERLVDFHSCTDFRVGWIPDVFLGLEDKRYAFAHIDVDLYQPTLDSCKYFYSRMTPGGVMLFDEYGFLSAHGEKLAVDEFFAHKPEKPIMLITGQAFLLKLPAA
jgi:O-methyltransferase